MPFDRAAAVAAGKRSGEVRRRRKNPNEAARDALLGAAKGAADVIAAVSEGRDGFEDAKPELRFKAATIVLEYVLGKPKGLTEEEPDDGTQTFEGLFGSPPPLEEPLEAVQEVSDVAATHA